LSDENKQCLKNESLIGICSCIFTIIIAFVILAVYSIDPLDEDLLLNEQAIYLTSKYSDSVKKIYSVSNFI
jgi:hypothetical protein